MNIRLSNLAAALVFSIAAPEAVNAATPLFGINLAGLEMGVGATANYDFAIPDPTYMESQNVGVMRLPFTIERLQPSANGAFNVAYLGYITSIIKANTASNVYTVLDPHDYGYISNDGSIREIGVDPIGTANYLNFIAALASASRGLPLLAIGLMNEPHNQTCSQLTPVWQRAISTIRATGFSGPIMVPPTNWSHADTFVSSGCGTSFLSLTDPANNLVFEIHNYLDPNQTGTYTQAIAAVGTGSQQLGSVISWAIANDQRLFVGETGSPPDTYSVSALDNELQTIRNHPDVFWGVSLWASSPWWLPTYVMRLDPVNGVPEPQMVELSKYLARPEALIVGMVEDAYDGDAEYTLSLDGQVTVRSVERTSRVGGVPDLVTLTGPFSSGAHTLRVTFLNDLYGDAANADRNLYVAGATFDGVALPTPFTELLTTGSSTTIGFVAP